MKKRSGFTLIELVMVIAVLAIVTVVGLSQYGTLKKKSAYKVATQNIKQIANALQVYALANENSETRFNNFDSLIDLSITGEGTGNYWTGTPGTYVWNATTNAPGIYDGSYKVLAATYNAVGGGGSTPEIESAKRTNAGISDTLAGKLGIYFLTADDVTAFNVAGFTTYLMHNCSTMQAHGLANRHPACLGTYNSEGYAFVEGGPGFRADMSAFYPTALRVGSPVAVLAPLSLSSNSTATVSATYRRFGYEISLTTNEINSLSTTTTQKDYESKLSSAKLVVFGIGPSSTFVQSKNGIGTDPRCEFYDRTYYRRFLAVFALTPKSGTTLGTVTPVGVLDCDGNTYKDDTYSVDWTLQ